MPSIMKEMEAEARASRDPGPVTIGRGSYPLSNPHRPAPTWGVTCTSAPGNVVPLSHEQRSELNARAHIAGDMIRSMIPWSALIEGNGYWHEVCRRLDEYAQL